MLLDYKGCYWFIRGVIGLQGVLLDYKGCFWIIILLKIIINLLIVIIILL